VAELKAKYGDSQLAATLTPGSGGVFSVLVDGTEVFSKKKVGRFPTYGEVPMAIDRMLLEK
jgi:selT/selW/selH-like putative selenoprotein